MGLTGEDMNNLLSKKVNLENDLRQTEQERVSFAYDDDNIALFY